MLDNNLPSWRQDLKSSRKKEGKLPSNRWMQLATVSEENEPRLRTVVFRGWDKDSSMSFIPLVILAIFFSIVFLPRMIKKDKSLSKYDSFEEYKKKSGLIFPKLNA